MVSFTLVPLYPPRVESTALSGRQSPSGICEEEENILLLAGIETRFLDPPSLSVVTILTTFSRLPLSRGVKRTTCLGVNYLECFTRQKERHVRVMSIRVCDRVGA